MMCPLIISIFTEVFRRSSGKRYFTNASEPFDRQIQTVVNSYMIWIAFWNISVDFDLKLFISHSSPWQREQIVNDSIYENTL
jgi:hypothetical protein